MFRLKHSSIFFVKSYTCQLLLCVIVLLPYSRVYAHNGHAIPSMFIHCGTDLSSCKGALVECVKRHARYGLGCNLTTNRAGTIFEVTFGLFSKWRPLLSIDDLNKCPSLNDLHIQDDRLFCGTVELDISIDNSQPANLGVSDHNTCNPINIATGNKFLSRSDFTGTNLSPIEISFFYNSHGVARSWTSSYTQSLGIFSNYIEPTSSNGQRLIFFIDNGYQGARNRSERLDFVDNQYQLRLPDNTVETYSVAGQLLSIQYPSGITHNVSYSNNNNTITVTRFNETLILDMVDGNVVKATLPDNSEINYTWDTSGDIANLTQVTYADNTTRTYLYENTGFPHYITGIVDENNNRISSVSYDSEGRAISSEVGTLSSGVDRTGIQYHADGTRTVTNSLGKQNTYHFEQFNGEYKMTQVTGHASANCAAANKSYNYTALGLLSYKLDWKGNYTFYTYNDRGLEISRVEAAYTREVRTITTEWHPIFNLRTKIREPERETVFTYDDQGRLISQEVTPR